MVPEVDKLNTHNDLDAIRTQVETIRQEIIDLVFEEAQDEKLALQKLTSRSLQQARQWVGKTLGQLGIRVYPYPNSTDSSTQAIDPTTVPQIDLDAQRQELSVVQRIKQARADLNELDAQLEAYLTKLIPGSRFNAFFLEAQKHLLQAGMWLGELLAEHVDTTPAAQRMNSTPWRETSLGEFATSAVTFTTTALSGESVDDHINRHFAEHDKLRADKAGPQYSAEALADIAAAKTVANSTETTPETSPANDSVPSSVESATVSTDPTVLYSDAGVNK